MKFNPAWLALIVGLVIIGCGGGGGGSGTGTGTGTATGTTSGSTGTLPSVTGNIQLPGNPPYYLTGAKVLFYDSGSTLVGTGITDVNGNFTVQLPLTAKAFTVDIADADTAGFFNREFEFNNLFYLTNNATIPCLAPLPALTAGSQTSLGTLDLSQSGTPPSPPTGCAP